MHSTIACSILVFFSWSHSNIGDIGITPGLLRLIEQHIPGAEVTVVANTKADATREYLQARFPKCRVVAAPFRDKEPSPEFTAAFEKADLILYNSGTTLSYGRWASDWNRTMRFALPLELARDAGKPYGVYCQSFERFAWPSDAYFRGLLSGADFVFCRDTNSLDYLKSLAVDPPILAFGPDATFAFDLSDEARADAFLKRHQLEPHQFVTLTIRTSIQGFIDTKREETHAEKLRNMVERWVRETGLIVLICPEVVHEIEPARRLIYDRLPEEIRRNVRFKEEFWLPDEAFSVYGRARAIVSMEMHSIILGLAAGTPVLHPRFEEAGRKAWMLRDLGVEEWLFDIDKQPAEEITAALMEIHKDHTAALAKVKSAMDIVHQGQRKTMATVQATIAKVKEPYPNLQILMEPAELARPELAERCVVLDVRSPGDYQAGHIPNAQHVSHDAFKEAFGDGEDREGWSDRIGKLGIGPDTPVVVYDDVAMKDAGRIWWILRYWGVNAKLLNGGWRGWRASNLPVSEAAPEVKPAEFHAKPAPRSLATKHEVHDLLRTARPQIVDARSREEYCGIDKKENDRGGAIPGAKLLEWSDLIDQKTHRFKRPMAIRKLIDQTGIDLDRPIATHCQSGGRASVMVFGLELMGAKDVRNYYRGWSEWGNDKSTPIVVPEK
ncbi:MAG: hypothetical protein GXY83_32365 [Rhodopirellula sp.]|nr:hypothetical protein [Rhodopirellula sp.]